MSATCQTCRFREPDKRPEYEGSGCCRRFPPQVSQWTHPDYNGPQYDQHWPWMASSDWCGEYQAREEGDAARSARPATQTASSNSQHSQKGSDAMNYSYNKTTAAKMLLNGEILPEGWMARLLNETELSLDGNQITDPSGLAALTGLKTLSLDGNQITDPSGLAALTGLEWLSLDGNQITDPSGLAALTGLEWLSLSGNQITDPSGLAALTGLKTLYLDANQITDPSGLAALTGLEWLHLSGNQITDPSGLAALEKAMNARIVR